MKTLILIQARMASFRLPGKILEEISGCSVLEHVVRRARHRGYAVAVAAPSGDYEAMAGTAGWRKAVVDNRGRARFVPVYFAATDEEDVLGRLAQTAMWADDMDRFCGGEGYGVVVRLTADCPFVPVDGIDAVAEAVASGANDYCETRSDPSRRPNGIDAQACTLSLLLEASVRHGDPGGRAHVTPALLEAAERPGRVSALEGMRLDDLPPFRITLDTPDDLRRYRALAGHLAMDPSAGRPTLTELRDLHRQEPGLFVIE